MVLALLTFPMTCPGDRKGWKLSTRTLQSGGAFRKQKEIAMLVGPSVIRARGRHVADNYKLNATHCYYV